MTYPIRPIKPGRLDGPCVALRAEVRSFLKSELEVGGYAPGCDCWIARYDSSFTRKLRDRGWLAMTWPRMYGGHERSQAERYVLIEEMLAAGAPVAGHWTEERQVGPSLLRFGSEELKQRLVPPIARGESVFGVCYSEPDVGSDLAAVRTRAERVAGGWRLTGTKIWTTRGHIANYLLVLCRTSAEASDRRKGLSVLIVELPNRGVTVRPIRLLTGEHHFNEIVFDGAETPDSMLLGEEGAGWSIVTNDLAIERSGPERFMSTLPLLTEMVRRAGESPEDARLQIAVGELIARFWSLRSMSISVAGLIEAGLAPNVEAALVKDLGTRFEGDVAQTARLLFPTIPSLGSGDLFTAYVAQAVLHSPAYTLRGGTNEVLRGIVARGLGVR